MKDTASLGAVVVHHDSGGTILNVLSALKAQTCRIASVVVVDNASQENTPEHIRTMFPDVELIQLKENVGLSRARNIGLRQANTDFVLLLDDDVYLESDAVRRMRDALGREAAAAICPRVVYYPGKDTIQSDGAAIHFAGLLTPLHAGESSGRPRELFAVDGLIGACMLVRRSALIDIGSFDEDYFFYFEDLEFSYRWRARGHKILCEPRAIAFHDRGQGTSGLSFRGTEAYPPRRAYFVLRHRWLTILLHYQVRTIWLLLPALFLYDLAALAECIRRGWISQWITASSWIVRNLHRIRVRRNRLQAHRQVPDRDILSGGPLPFAPGFVRNNGMRYFVQLLDAVLDHYWRLVQGLL
jgi:GT2 family glycosyltransferase